MELEILDVLMVHRFTRRDDEISLPEFLGPVPDVVALLCLLPVVSGYISRLSYTGGPNVLLRRQNMFRYTKMVSVILASIFLMIRQPLDQVYPDAARFLVFD